MKDRLVELRLWRQFVAVAQELHFGRAAERLYMTQPPLTQAIAQLEKLLQVRLFDRTKRSVRLTTGGAALLPEVLDLLARAQALPDRARAAAAGEIGRVRLAFVSTVGFTLLPQWVMAFREQQPQVRLELVEATGDVQLRGFARGEIDAGFMLHAPGFASEGLTQLRVTHEPLMLALPTQHRLALRKAAPTLREVLDEPLVIFPRRIAPSLHDAIFGLYHRAGAVPVVAQEAIQMQTIVNLVSAGFGVAWVPETVRQFQRPGVCYRRIRVARKTSGSSAVSADAMTHCETSLVWSDTRANPALQRFIDFARQQVP